MSSFVLVKEKTSNDNVQDGHRYYLRGKDSGLMVFCPFCADSFECGEPCPMFDVFYWEEDKVEVNLFCRAEKIEITIDSVEDKTK